MTGGFWGYVWVAALFGLVNAFIGTFLKILTLPLTILTLGISTLGLLVLVGWAREVSLAQAGLTATAIYLCGFAMRSGTGWHWPYLAAAALGMSASRSRRTSPQLPPATCRNRCSTWSPAPPPSAASPTFPPAGSSAQGTIF